jgi:hypothetical protein
VKPNFKPKEKRALPQEQKNQKKLFLGFLELYEMSKFE